MQKSLLKYYTIARLIYHSVKWLLYNNNNIFQYTKHDNNKKIKKLNIFYVNT